MMNLLQKDVRKSQKGAGLTMVNTYAYQEEKGILAELEEVKIQDLGFNPRVVSALEYESIRTLKDLALRAIYFGGLSYALSNVELLNARNRTIVRLCVEREHSEIKAVLESDFRNWALGVVDGAARDYRINLARMQVREGSEILIRYGLKKQDKNLYRPSDKREVKRFLDILKDLDLGVFIKTLE